MRVIVFDTETTGLPTERNASYQDTDKWPHVVQLSFIVYNTKKCEVEVCHDYIIQLKDGVTISPDSQAIHGITPEKCKKKGIPISMALTEFGEYVSKADLLVAHNLSFDKKVLLASYTREKMIQPFFDKGNVKPGFCTMLRTVDFPVVIAKNAKGEYYNKFPKLVELHEHLFGNKPKGLHNSMADVIICLRCYMKLQHKYDVLSKEDSIVSRLHGLYCVSD